MTNHLTHLDANGDIAMVDVSTKTATTRTATAVRTSFATASSDPLIARSLPGPTATW